MNNIDHIRISGSEPSSVILCQTKYCIMLKRDSQIYSKTKLIKTGWSNKPIKL